MRIGIVLMMVVAYMACCAPAATAAPIVGPDGCQVPPTFDAATSTMTIDGTGEVPVFVTVEVVEGAPRVTIRISSPAACPGAVTAWSYTSQTTTHPLAGVRTLRLQQAYASASVWEELGPLVDPTFVIEAAGSYLTIGAATPARWTAIDATGFDLDGDGRAELRLAPGSSLKASGSIGDDVVDLRLLDPEVHTDIALLAGSDTWYGPNGVSKPIPRGESFTCAHAAQLGADADTAIGGGGIDCVSGGQGPDSLWGGAGDDRLMGQVDPNLPHDGKDAVPTDTSIDILRGDAGNDTIDGGAGPDRLFGGAGNDTLNGRAGRDIVQGEVGNDSLRDGKGADLQRGGPGNDLVEGTYDSADRLYGGSGNDTIRAMGGGDRAWGEAGHDHVIAAYGSIGWGGAGDDLVESMHGIARVYGQHGNDFIVASHRSTGGTLWGGPGVDRFATAHITPAMKLRIRMECGPGIDRVVSKVNRVHGCERRWECFTMPLSTCSTVPWGDPRRDPGHWVSPYWNPTPGSL